MSHNSIPKKIPPLSLGDFTIVPTEDTGLKPFDEHGICKEKKSFVSKYGGMTMGLCASLFFSVSFLIIKILGNSYGFKPFGSALLFNVGMVIPCILTILMYQCGPWGRNRPNIFAEIWPLTNPTRRTTFVFLLIQATLQASSVIFRSYALQYLAIGDMTVIVFSSPVVTTIIAYFLLGEPIGIFFIFIALFTLIGVALVTKPPLLTGAESFDENTMIGTCLAVGAMLSLSFTFAVTRKIKSTHVLLMALFLGSVGVITSSICCAIFEGLDTIIPKDLNEGLLISCLVTAFLSIVSINTALKLEDAGPIALIRSCDVIFAFLLQFVFLDVIPDMLSAIGAAIVVGGVLLTGFRKWLMTLPEDAKQRKYCACCLK